MNAEKQTAKALLELYSNRGRLSGARLQMVNGYLERLEAPKTTKQATMISAGSLETIAPARPLPSSSREAAAPKPVVAAPRPAIASSSQAPVVRAAAPVYTSSIVLPPVPYSPFNQSKSGVAGLFGKLIGTSSESAAGDPFNDKLSAIQKNYEHVPKNAHIINLNNSLFRFTHDRSDPLTRMGLLQAIISNIKTLALSADTLSKTQTCYLLDLTAALTGKKVDSNNYLRILDSYKTNLETRDRPASGPSSQR